MHVHTIRFTLMRMQSTSRDVIKVGDVNVFRVELWGCHTPVGRRILPAPTAGISIETRRSITPNFLNSQAIGLQVHKIMDEIIQKQWCSVHIAFYMYIYVVSPHRKTTLFHLHIQED